MRASRFEVVRSDAGWFVRFVGANGRIVWVTPGLYSKRAHTFRAVELIAGTEPRDVGHGLEVVVCGLIDRDELLEVREVDERGPSDG